MKLLIADDHVLIRKGLIKIITTAIPGIEVTEAENGFDVIRLLKQNKYDAIIMDVSMPEMNGIDALKHIRATDKSTGILILSMHEEEHFAIRAIKAGANGYLTKSASPEELVNALHIIVAGKKYITPAVAEKMASSLQDKRKQYTHEALSDREFAVLRMIASGKQVSQIATELNLSLPTVSTYRSRIMNKMGMKTNAELTHYAITNKLL